MGQNDPQKTNIHIFDYCSNIRDYNYLLTLSDISSIQAGPIYIIFFKPPFPIT